MPSADACWIALRNVRGVGPRVYRLMLDKFGSPDKVFEASTDEIAGAGIPRQTALNIADFRDFDDAEKELCELPRIGARLVRWNDADYPPNLRHMPDPPPYMFV